MFESARRLADSLADLAAVLGDRPAAVCRELTKRFETVRRGSLLALAGQFEAEGPPKGEIVIVIGPPDETAETDAHADIDKKIEAALQKHSAKDAAAIVAGETGLPRRKVYARVLELAGARAAEPDEI